MNCYDKCPDHLYNNAGECVEDCLTYNKLILDKDCVTSCPLDTLNIKDNECFPPLPNTKEEIIVINTSKEKVFERIEIDTFTDEGKSIIGDDYTLQIYPLTNPLIERNSISTIDLGPCEAMLKQLIIFRKEKVS